MMLIWEVLETLFRWGIAGGSGDYGRVLGDWDLVLVSSSLGISLLSGCGMNSLTSHAAMMCCRIKGPVWVGLRTEGWHLWDRGNTNPFLHGKGIRHLTTKWGIGLNSPSHRNLLDIPIWIAHDNTRHCCYVGKQFDSVLGWLRLQLKKQPSNSFVGVHSKEMSAHSKIRMWMPTAVLSVMVKSWDYPKSPLAGR